VVCFFARSATAEYVGRYQRRTGPRGIRSRYTAGSSRVNRFNSRGRRGSLRRLLDDFPAAEEPPLPLAPRDGEGETVKSGESGKKVVTDAPRAAMTHPKKTKKTPSSARADAAAKDNRATAVTSSEECVTPLHIIETHPDLTRLRDAVSDLPAVRAALADRSAAHTFFAPTDAACFRFTQWWGCAGFRV
jgi:hypothetical protein